jgi:hypothetical protein
MTIDQVIAGYIQLRDLRDDLKKKQAVAMKELTDKMFKLEAYIQKVLVDSGQESAKTASGTAFLQTDTTVAVDDFDATLAFIKQRDLWAMLEKRVSKSVVADYIESTSEIPPGLRISREISCHIRRPGGK